MAKSINYELLSLEKAVEVHDDLTQKMNDRKRDNEARADSLRHYVLDLVVKGNYEKAEGEIQHYIEVKKDYPNFIAFVNRYKDHCFDLIAAIKAKRELPGLASLSLSKQQEIHEKVLQHFEELKMLLKQIEVKDKEFTLQDIKTTAWFVQTVSNCVIFFVCFAFALDMFTGLGTSFQLVFDALVRDLVDFASRFI